MVGLVKENMGDNNETFQMLDFDDHALVGIGLLYSILKDRVIMRFVLTTYSLDGQDKERVILIAAGSVERAYEIAAESGKIEYACHLFEDLQRLNDSVKRALIESKTGEGIINWS